MPISYHGRSLADGKKITWLDGVRCLAILLKVRLDPATRARTGLGRARRSAAAAELPNRQQNLVSVLAGSGGPGSTNSRQTATRPDPNRSPCTDDRRRDLGTRVGADQGRPDRHGEQITLVGPGFHLLGGLSVYTCRMAQALTAEFDVSVLLLHKVVPSRLVSGRASGGSVADQPELSPIRCRSGPRSTGTAGSVWRAPSPDLRPERRPDLLVLQWWTAATLHTYLVLALAARLARVPVVIEFHETQDTGEAGVPLVARYCRTLMPLLIRLGLRSSGAQQARRRPAAQHLRRSVLRPARPRSSLRTDLMITWTRTGRTTPNRTAIPR